MSSESSLAFTLTLRGKQHIEKDQSYLTLVLKADIFLDYLPSNPNQEPNLYPEIYGILSNIIFRHHICRITVQDNIYVKIRCVKMPSVTFLSVTFLP